MTTDERNRKAALDPDHPQGTGETEHNANRTGVDLKLYDPSVNKPGQAIADIMESWLRYNPQIMAQNVAAMQQYTPEFQAMVSRLLGQDISDVTGMAPSLLKLQEAGERPQVTAMRNMLLDQTLGELSMGGRLTPQQELDLTEGVRSAQFARGMGPFKSDALRESVARSLEGMNLLAQRQNKASALIGKENAEAPDPMSLVGKSTDSALQLGSQTVNNPMLSFMGQNYWQEVQKGMQQAQYENTMSLALANLQNQQNQNNNQGKNAFGGGY
jgi:hypothetical protein